MIIPKKLNKNDTVAIISLSSGVLGEDFAKHQLNLAIKRLKNFGLNIKIMGNSLKGIDYIKNHPEKRAKDLKNAFKDNSIKAIFCAIGGEDTYKTLPFLMEDKEFLDLLKNNPKIFSGFSDTTINHLMFYKLGLRTYYGMNILNDIAELDEKMLSYTEKYFLEYFNNNENILIKPSKTWYEERKNFSKNELNTSRISHIENRGFELLQGSNIFKGELYGGCIESIYSAISGYRNLEQKEITKKYNLILKDKELKNKILFLETSENKTTPNELKKILREFEDFGLFENISGLIVGKPQDEVYYEEYKKIYKEVLNEKIPILYNVNFGHSYPRTILAYGAEIEVNANKNQIKYLEKILR